MGINSEVVTQPAISSENTYNFDNALKIDEVLIEKAAGGLSGGVYYSETIMSFTKRPFSAPPRVFCFRATIPNGILTQSDVLPTFETEFYLGLLFISSGFIVKRWSELEVSSTSVKVTTYSVNPYTESYTAYVLLNKGNEQRSN